MSQQTDSLENYVIDGNLTIKAGLNIDNGLGDLEVEGSIYTDNIAENTLDAGVNLEGTKFKDNSFTMTQITIPSTPSVNTDIFYIDSIDNFLKSINSSGTIKIYNPLANKGDLLSHNGTIDTILPVGTNGQVLIADSISPTGLSWSNTDITNSSIPSQNTFTIITQNVNTYILSASTGSYYLNLSPLVPSGASCMFFTSKSIHTNGGSIYRMNNNRSLINSGNLNFVWSAYRLGAISKNYSEANGDYLNNNNASFSTNMITLTGTSWVTINGSTTGAFFYSISSSLEGPCITFAICKSDSTVGSGALFIISSSQSVSGNNLNLRWQSGGGVQISKNTSNDNGTYNVIDNFQNITNTSVTLTGTSSTSIPKPFFQFYENKSFILRVYSIVSNSPKSIIFMSKNNYILNGIQTSVNSPGSTTLEQLRMNWSANSLLSLNKTGINYDGIYQIDISPF